MNDLPDWARTIAASRKPDICIGGEANPYLRRWYVIPRNKEHNIYLHHFMRSDDDRALHSHPWSCNISVLLTGRYLEHTHAGPIVREAGAVVHRAGEAWHRVELIDGPVWTLFLTGPIVREWGFECPHGFVHWRDFTAGKNGEIVGKGCEQ